MSANLRSISGALLMLVIIPIVAGLLACMPVPVGNPERSRIDPALNGVWIVESEGDAGGLYLLQPWDKRTWLVAGVGIEEGSGYEGEAFVLETAQDAADVLRRVPVGSAGIKPPNPVLYKAWLTKLGGQQFMTWEAMGGFNDDGSHAPEYWFVWRVERRSADRVEYSLVIPEHEIFDDIVKPSDYEGDDYVAATRRRWERALAKAARQLDDDELYGDPAIFTRLPDDLLDEASRLFERAIQFE